MSDMNELADAMTKVKESKKTKWIVGGVITAIIIMLIVGFTIGRYNPDPNSKVVQELLNTMLVKEKETYEKTIKQKESENLKIQSMLTQSQNINIMYQNEITKLKDKLKNVKPPETEKEIRERLRGLGYETN